jgi:hypothetical protein
MVVPVGQDRRGAGDRRRRDPFLDDPRLRREAGRRAGPLAELWFEAEQEGVYFGQCSELCGINHAYMPITVKVVSEEAYEAWAGEAQEFAEYGQHARAAQRRAGGRLTQWAGGGVRSPPRRSR